MKRWEYTQVEGTTPAIVQAMCDSLGKEGWELVAVAAVPTRERWETWALAAFLKRELPE